MDRILLGHGSGGRMMHDLIRDYFVPVFDIKALDDAAVINTSEFNSKLLTPYGSDRLNSELFRLAFTTDSYVVDPIFFPAVI